MSLSRLQFSLLFNLAKLTETPAEDHHAYRLKRKKRNRRARRSRAVNKRNRR